MMNGSALLEGYVPELDATVVTRILDAGGTIAGKAPARISAFRGKSILAQVA
jgi:amidase